MYGILEVWLNQIIAPCVVGAVISKQCPSILAFAALYTYTKEAAAELGYMPCPICNP